MILTRQQKRFAASCLIAKGNQRHVTMLWNYADCQRDPTSLWAILCYLCSEAFDDPRDANTIRFAY